MNPHDLDVETASELLAARHALRQQIGFVKASADPGFMSRLMSGSTPGMMAARNALIGGGLGAATGAATSLFAPKKRKDPLSRMLTGGLIGAGLGGGGTLAYQGGKRFFDPQADDRAQDAAEATTESFRSGTGGLSQKKLDANSAANEARIKAKQDIIDAESGESKSLLEKVVGLPGAVSELPDKGVKALVGAAEDLGGEGAGEAAADFINSPAAGYLGMGTAGAAAANLPGAARIGAHHLPGMTTNMQRKYLAKLVGSPKLREHIDPIGKPGLSSQRAAMSRGVRKAPKALVRKAYKDMRGPRAKSTIKARGLRTGGGFAVGLLLEAIRRQAMKKDKP